MTPQDFRSAHPDLFFLDLEDRSALARYLEQHAVLNPGESVAALEKAGDGNMNCTARVTTTSRSFIVKQSRPWVEKYPQFEAPWDRALREVDFYKLTATVPCVARFLPRLLFFSARERILVLEDLGRGGDYSGIYRGEVVTTATVIHLAEFLSALHGAFRDLSPRPSLANHEMRALNHAHIFDIPLKPDNRLDLDAIQPGLQFAADKLKESPVYCAEVARLGRDIYLVDGPSLLHGDFFPGSLVRTASGPRVIDPEFSFFGRAEYDVAVFLAHLFLGSQSISLWQSFREHYSPPEGYQESLVHQLAGVEIMRRLIGYAQLPLIWGVYTRHALLKLSYQLVLEPDQAVASLPTVNPPQP